MQNKKDKPYIRFTDYPTTFINHKIHDEISKNEKDSTSVEAVHKTEYTAEKTANTLNRFYRKIHLKKQYKTTKQTKATGKKAVKETKTISKFIWKHKTGILITAGIIFFVIWFVSVISSLTAVFLTGTAVIYESEYQTEQQGGTYNVDNWKDKQWNWKDKR